jgi:hypothetical protein
MEREMRIRRFVVIALVAGSTLGSASADDLPPGPAHDKVQQACTQCHGLDVVVGQRMSRDGWADTVARMIGNGAPITGADQPKIVDYLARNFPAK